MVRVDEYLGLLEECLTLGLISAGLGVNNSRGMIEARSAKGITGLQEVGPHPMPV